MAYTSLQAPVLVATPVEVSRNVLGLRLVSKSFLMLLLKFTSQDSDCEEKSLSQDDSFDAMSDIMCGEHYNTLKKGPNWTETQTTTSPIEPPLEFQDRPKTPSPVIDFFCDRLTHQILKRVMRDFRDQCCFGPLRLTV